MKIYTFIYYDSKCDFNEGRSREFSCSASRFSVAFKAYVKFIVSSCFDYFTFNITYIVEGKNSRHLRILPSDYFNILDKMRRLPND